MDAHAEPWHVCININLTRLRLPAHFYKLLCNRNMHDSAMFLMKRIGRVHVELSRSYTFALRDIVPYAEICRVCPL